MPKFKHEVPVCTTLNDLIQVLIGQAAFMKSAAEKEDRNFHQLSDFSLDEFYKNAMAYFQIRGTEFDNCILFEDSEESELFITEFLRDYSEVLDVVAVQKNVHQILSSFPFY